MGIYLLKTVLISFMPYVLKKRAMCNPFRVIMVGALLGDIR